MIRIVLLLVSLAVSASAQDPYWVSPTGTASWASAQSATPLSGTAAASMQTAENNAVAGDVVKFRGGTYNNAELKPTNSGTLGNMITFEAYEGEEPILDGVGGDGDVISIWITRSYITIRGFTVRDTDRHYIIRNASYVELDNCRFSTPNARNGLVWADVGESTTHIWIHHCTYTDMGAVNNGVDGAGPKVGTHVVGLTGDEVSHVTVENCTFETAGGHHNLEISAPESVIRNNFFRHEGTITATGTTPAYAPMANGKYGNRNLFLEAFHNSSIRPRMLAEGNRIGPSGAAPDDIGGDGLPIASNENIVRYNEIYGAQNNGIMFKIGEYGDPGRQGSNNRVYNNTVYASGQYDNVTGASSPYATTPDWHGASLRYWKSTDIWPLDNQTKNNIFYGHLGASEVATQGTTARTDNTEANNHWQADGDPLFVDDTIAAASSRALPVLALQSGSPAIDNGGALTTVAVADTGSGTSLVVEDALYFQDGTKGSALSNIQPDWIAVGSVDNVVEIASIDYATNTITLANSISRSDGESVWLYKKSDGERVLYGTAPDQGAFEYTTRSGILSTGSVSVGP